MKFKKSDGELHDIKIYKDKRTGWCYLDLTYRYVKGDVIRVRNYPRVRLPIPTDRLPDTHVGPTDYYPSLDDYRHYLIFDDEMMLEAEMDLLKNVTCIDYTYGPAPKKMTLADIQKELGYEIELVDESKGE